MIIGGCDYYSAFRPRWRNGGKEKFQLIKEKKRGKINGKRLADSARSAERMINMTVTFDDIRHESFD